MKCLRVTLLASSLRRVGVSKMQDARAERQEAKGKHNMEAQGLHQLIILGHRLVRLARADGWRTHKHI